MARSTKLEYWTSDEGINLIRGWVRRGLTEEQIAQTIGISRTTLWKWKGKSQTLVNVLKEEKEIIDNQVESALLRKALGFTSEEVKEMQYIDKDTGELVTARREVTLKHHAPDTTAGIFWLKNRRPDLWRDRIIEQGDQTENNLSNFFDALKNSITSSSPPTVNLPNQTNPTPPEEPDSEPDDEGEDDGN